MDPMFQVHMLNGVGKAKANLIAQAFNNLIDELAINCPPGREWSIVRTKLEEACFFAKKSMANVAENQGG